MDAVTLTEIFLNHVFAGEMDEAASMVASDARLIGSRAERSDDNPIFGTYIGPDGARAFFQAFGDVMEPGEFIVTDKFGTNEKACFYGQLRHTVRATGKPFPSDWALVTQVSDGKLSFYHFYEDTAALATAMR